MEVYLFLLFIFWILVYLSIHTYVIYPLSISLIASIKSKKNSYSVQIYPHISILIAAYNEEKVIAERIKNISELNYDLDKLEVIVGSDGSTDKTNEILNSLEQKYEWLLVKVFTEQRGKAAVLNDLVEAAKYSILVFTDANTEFDGDALKNLAPFYSDLQVGGVSGRLILDEPASLFDKTNREKVYWEYETFLKKHEGKLGLLIGANGGIFSVRKELFKKIPLDGAVTDDLYITLIVLESNYKFLYAYSAVAREEVSRELISEFRRKIRFASTNFQTLKCFRKLLFNKKLLLSYAFWSHKVIRWYLPFILIALLIINLIILPVAEVYKITLLVQILLYVLSVAGLLFSLINVRIPLLSLISFFSLTNAALFIGYFNYRLGKHKAMWESTPR